MYNIVYLTISYIYKQYTLQINNRVEILLRASRISSQVNELVEDLPQNLRSPGIYSFTSN